MRELSSIALSFDFTRGGCIGIHDLGPCLLYGSQCVVWGKLPLWRLLEPTSQSQDALRATVLEEFGELGPREQVRSVPVWSARRFRTSRLRRSNIRVNVRCVSVCGCIFCVSVRAIHGFAVYLWMFEDLSRHEHIWNVLPRASLQRWAQFEGIGKEKRSCFHTI